MLSHVATDGESYGHHHRTARWRSPTPCTGSRTTQQANLTNYGEFLARFPPRWEAEVVEDTSWSCAHGVERWRSNCGCNGGKPGWNQEWRGPSARALDLLRDATAPLAEAARRSLSSKISGPRATPTSTSSSTARRHNIDAFFAEHATHELTPDERITALELLELERHTQLMYTSCGWFFDEISGIETVQIIAYAGRVLQLAAKLFGEPGAALETSFLDILAERTKQHPRDRQRRRGLSPLRHQHEDRPRAGRRPLRHQLHLPQLPRARRALLLQRPPRSATRSSPPAAAASPSAAPASSSRITEESEEICFAVLHLGDQNLSAAVRRYDSNDAEQVAAFDKFSADIAAAMRRANLPEVIRLIDHFFGGMAYSLLSLFADEQHRILKTILTQTLSEMEDSLRKIYEDHASLLDFLTETGMAAPPALEVAANFAINATLRRALEAENFDAGDGRTTLSSAPAAEHITLNGQHLSFSAGQRMKRAMVAA